MNPLSSAIQESVKEDEVIVKQDNTQSIMAGTMAIWGFSSLGGGIGLFMAYKNNFKFWGYVGFFLLGSMIFGGLAQGIINLKDS